MALLAQAREYAEELACDVWDFAVEIDTLRGAGLTNSDLRWLLCKGYVAHSRETFQRGHSAREFHDAGGLVFTKRSCFVLTEAGTQWLAVPPVEAYARMSGGNGSGHDPRSGVPSWNGWFDGRHRDPLLNGTGPHDVAEIAENENVDPDLGTDYPPRIRTSGDRGVVPNGLEPLRPHWDLDQRELYLGAQLVKRFKLPSPNQQTILMAFEEEGWPPRIDDPLPHNSHIDPKRRLRDTIKSLNRKQKRGQLRFMGDGTGQGIRWCLADRLDASQIGS
jgi:hypothetical protein